MPGDQPITQWLNSDQVDILRPWFVDRNEPNYAWQHACSAVLALPALRAFWPMSSVDYTTASRARDVAGGGYHLSDNNTVLFGSGQSDALPNMAPYAEFDGINQYLSRADGGAANWADITGTEAYVTAAQRGLTLGGWFRFDTSGANMGLLAKWGAVAVDRPYLLRRDTLNRASMIVNNFTGTIISTAVSALAWTFIVGRFVPSAEVAVFVNSVKFTAVAAIPAALTDGAAQFTIGADAAALQPLDGRASLCFLCAAALSDSIIGALFQSTRKFYGV